MADNNILPKAQSPVTDAAGRPTRAFYDFFRALVNRVQGQIDGLSQAVATLAKIVASLGGDPDNLPDISAELDAKADKSTTVAGRYSIGGGGTLDSDVYVWLKGDIETPPVMSFYGVLDATAGRGWNLISDNFAAVDNGDDTYTLDLADLADSGTGAALLKITRDAKGRISGTSAATTTDLTEGTNLYYTDARADARITAAKADPDGIASLLGGKLDPGQLPSLAITDTFVVNTEAAMLALDCEQGDVAVRTDLNKSFILTADPPSTLSNWQELLTPTGGVTSFKGRTGPVVPASGDYTFAQIASTPTTLSGYGITDAVPASRTINGKALSSNVTLAASDVGAEPAIAAGTTAQYRRGDKTWQALNKAAVGLSHVDDTSDADKPVSTAQAAADALKYDKAGGDLSGNMRVVKATTVEAQFELDSGVAIARHFYRDSDWNYGMYLTGADGLTKTRFRFDGTNMSVETPLLEINGKAAWHDGAGWVALTPQNGWTNLAGQYGSVSARQVGDCIFLRGVLNGGTVTDGTVVLTLPSGMRPVQTEIFPAASLSTSPAGRIAIPTNGQVFITGITSSSFLALSGIHFFVD